MTRSVSTTEAKNNLSAILSDVATKHEDVIVESHGKPKAVIVSFEEYAALREDREAKRRNAAIERLRQARREVIAANEGLTSDEAMAEAGRVMHEIIDRMIANGSIVVGKRR